MGKKQIPALPAVGIVRRGYSATGGAEAYLQRLAAGLRERGCRVTLYASEDWPPDQWPQEELVRLKATEPLEFARAFQKARRPGEATLALDRVPGCDVFRAGDGVHAAWLERRRHFEPAWAGWLRRWNPKHTALLSLEREVFSSTSTIIANSRMVAAEITDWYGVPSDRIHVVPNGIGQTIPRIPKDEARARLEIPAGEFCVLFVGTGWERKGLRFAIDAVEMLGDDALLLVAGRGPVHRYDSDWAKFLGPVKDLSALFSAADVFALPTIYDPFSNACLEALAFGLPVVSSTANGFSEIITPGAHGEVVKPGDAEAVASALGRWRGRDAAMTAAACQALAKDYSIDRNVERTLDILMEATRR